MRRFHGIRGWVQSGGERVRVYRPTRGRRRQKQGSSTEAWENFGGSNIGSPAWSMSKSISYVDVSSGVTPRVDNQALSPQYHVQMPTMEFILPSQGAAKGGEEGLHGYPDWRWRHRRNLRIR